MTASECARAIAKELGFTLEAHPAWERAFTDAVRLARVQAFREAKREDLAVEAEAE